MVKPSVQDRRFRCEKCTKFFLNNEFLQKHFNNYHPNLVKNKEEVGANLETKVEIFTTTDEKIAGEKLIALKALY